MGAIAGAGGRPRQPRSARRLRRVWFSDRARRSGRRPCHRQPDLGHRAPSIRRNGRPIRSAKRSVTQPVDCARQCRGHTSAISAISKSPEPCIARASICAAGCTRWSATPRRPCATLAVSLEQCRRQIERDLGNLEAARAAYGESLDIARRLREAVGDTPQGLRDLSIALNQVGNVERDLGNLEAARAARRESLDLFRRLREAVGDTPQALRALGRSRAAVSAKSSAISAISKPPAPPIARASISSADCARRSARPRRRCATCRSRSNKVGEVERDLGNLEAARAPWRESLDIARRLSGAFPDQSSAPSVIWRWIEAQMKAMRRTILTAARRKVRH